MRLAYITLPLSALMAGSGIWLMVSASHAQPANSPSSGLEPRHPVTAEMARDAAAMDTVRAPDFRLPDSTGKEWNLASLSAGKPLFLYFILDGCPCSTDAEPLFHALYARYQGHVAFAGVIGSDQETAAKWAKEHQMPYTILADPRLASIHAYHAKHSAYSVLILPNGSIDKMWPGYSQDALQDMSARMAAATGQTPRPFDALYAPLKLSSGCFFPN